MSKPASRENHLWLVGCGRMGTAIVTGWLKSLNNIVLTIIDPELLPQKLETLISEAEKNGNRIRHVRDTDTLNHEAENPACIFMAVKPALISTVFSNLSPFIRRDTTLISIAAGIPLNSLEKAVNTQCPIVRAMPNTPGAIGKGITAATGNGFLNDALKMDAIRLLEPLGEVLWIEDETHMDAVTGVSGSGPAYIFHFIEALTEAAESEGLPLDICDKLARQTVYGAAALAVSDEKISAARLRENVTSPGGTTEEGLKVLMDKDALKQLVKNAVHAAAEKSRHLGGGKN